jgi:hypothetical protein
MAMPAAYAESTDFVDQVITRSLKSFERNHCRVTAARSTTDLRKTYLYRNYVAFSRKVNDIARQRQWTRPTALAFVDYCSSTAARRNLLRFGLGALIQDRFLDQCRLRFERQRQELLSTRRAVRESLERVRQLWHERGTPGQTCSSFLAGPLVGLANLTRLYKDGTLHEAVLTFHAPCRRALALVRRRDPVQAGMLPSDGQLATWVKAYNVRLGYQLITEIFGDQQHHS